jgi:hypothetical protein
MTHANKDLTQRNKTDPAGSQFDRVVDPEVMVGDPHHNLAVSTTNLTPPSVNT